MDYGKTLNLPKTDFPMRANLPQREPEILKFWGEIDIYRLVQEANAGKEKFILHDGPPYANGDIHLGHTLNKVLKDIVVKFHSLTGYDAPFVPGWDTHGLPIEQQAIKALGLNRHSTSVVEFRHKCRDYALKYVDVQREEFKRLGVRGDWDSAYLTLMPHYEAVQIGVFGEMAKKGYIYKGLKPVYWCADCETALAEAEIEYGDKVSPSVYVKFAVKDARGLFDAKEANFVIWTTTPWTLPANVAIAVHPDFTYDLIEVKGEKLMVARELAESLLSLAGGEGRIVGSFKGRELERVVCRHPFMNRDSLVILGEHVTLEQGTGCVHTAPGHGEEDFLVAREYDLPVVSPLDDKGKFTEEGGKFAGMFCQDANQPIIEELQHRGALIATEKIQHQYPHCWRCRSPIIYRATEQWFASIDGFRKAALKAIENVTWIPAWGEDRIHNMVADRSDWCISRQRTWGVPIPIFYCGKCSHTIISDETIRHIQAMFREHGSDVWFARAADDLVPPGLVCPECGHDHFRKESDIMDVWFDSGSSHMAVLEQWPGLQWPADLYLEGSDQHRGWFNSSLSTAVAARGTAPYRTVLTHGFLVDEQGRKMSKSLGNGIDPLDVIEKLGADILRLWVSSADYRSDVAASDNILKQVAEAYRKIRNTCRFLLGNLYDFDPVVDGVELAQMEEIDLWAMRRLQKLVEKVTAAYKNYEFHIVYHAVHNFCAVDMSAFYMDVAKDRVYCSRPDSAARRSAQTVMFQVLKAVVQMLTPVLSYTCEEMWSYLPKESGSPVSVQLAGWPELPLEGLERAAAQLPHELTEKYRLSDGQPKALEVLEAKWDRLLDIRQEVAKALELARQDKVIGHSLAAQVNIYAEGELCQFLAPMAKSLETLFIVSAVNLQEAGPAVPEGAYTSDKVPGLTVTVSQAPGEKCERCWIYTPTVGQDKEHPTVCERCAEVVASQES